MNFLAKKTNLVGNANMLFMLRNILVVKLKTLFKSINI